MWPLQEDRQTTVCILLWGTPKSLTLVVFERPGDIRPYRSNR